MITCAPYHSLKQLVSLAVFLCLIAPAAIAQEEEALLDPDAQRDYSLNPLRPSEIAPKATDEVAARIIELHLQARGGRERLQNIRSLLLEGTLVEGPADYHVLWRLQGADRMRFDRYRKHLGWNYHTIWVRNGDSYWTRQLQPEKGAARTIRAESVNSYAYNPDLLSPLLHHKEEGHLFAYDGEQKFRGKSVYVLKAKLKDGPIVFYYFDANTFHLLNFGFRDDFAGSEVSVDRRPTGLRSLNGVWLETGYTWSVAGEVYRTVRYGRMHVNEHFEDELFEKPVVKEVWLKGENAQ